MYRLHPRMARVRALIEEGAIGSLRGIHSVFTFNNAQDKQNIRYRSDWGGGSLYDVGCYPLTAARFVTGQEPLAATVQAMFSPEHDNVDMMASGLIEFAGGVSLTFDCGMWAAFRQSLEIVGTDGRIEVPNTFLPGNETSRFLLHAGGESREETVAACNQYALQIDDFARVVFKESAPKYAPEDAVKNMKLMDACLESARTHSRVSL